MRIATDQRFATASVAEIVAAFRSADLHDAFTDLPFVGTPRLVDHRVDGPDVRVVVACAVDIDLPRAAHAFVDPARLTFQELTTLAEDGSGSFRIVPDHYPKLLTAHGTIRTTGSDAGVVRRIEGDLAVDLGWKGALLKAPVEQAIADGFTKAIRAQVSAVELFLAR